MNQHDEMVIDQMIENLKSEKNETINLFQHQKDARVKAIEEIKKLKG